jgi:prepilin-type N-terminal cleavage/methylation domain-containing protein
MAVRARRTGRIGKRGFTLVELMIALGIASAVLGTTVALATQLQQAYSIQLDAATVQEELRFALDWISRLMRSAGSNPYNIALSPCPEANTVFQAIRLDPNGNGVQDDVRIQADVNPANGLLVGAAGACSETGEDITVALDQDDFVITRQDHAIDDAPIAISEPIFKELIFTYLDSARAETVDPASIVSAQIRVTGQSKALHPITGEYTRSTLATEVRLRTR